jgi:hypothetical protein
MVRIAEKAQAEIVGRQAEQARYPLRGDVPLPGGRRLTSEADMATRRGAVITSLLDDVAGQQARSYLAARKQQAGE